MGTCVLDTSLIQNSAGTKTKLQTAIKFRRAGKISEHSLVRNFTITPPRTVTKELGQRSGRL